MKTLYLGSSPTRNRRVNEILGLMVLVGAGLLLLALCTYTPTDPSFDTVGGVGASIAGMARPAHNWAGLVGAYFADAMLQVFGIAAFFLPLVLVRLGWCWLRSRRAGSAWAKLLGLLLWVVLAPAAVSLLPGGLLWRSSLPIAGLSGLVVGDAMVHLLNLPGASIVVTLMVALSLYLATTFSFGTGREWVGARFGFLAVARERWAGWRGRNAGATVGDENGEDENGEVYGARRAKLDEAARRERERLERAQARESGESNTLLGGLFGWWLRRRQRPAEGEGAGVEAPAASVSMWEAMPRTNVDAPAVTALGVASAAAAPYAEALAAAAAPLPLQPDEMDWRADAPVGVAGAAGLSQMRFAEEEEEPFSFVSKASAKPLARPEAMVPSAAGSRPAHGGVAFLHGAQSVAAQVVATQGLGARRIAGAQPVAGPPGGPEPVRDNISFGRRADAEIKPVAITAKSVRGYKLPSSSLLYRSEEQAVVREEALREEARVLVEKCGEFGVDGQVVQINPGPVVTTFEFRPDAGVKYSRVTGLADDLCLAMAAESILIERMAGKSTVGIQVPNHDRETIWLRDVVECESFAQSKSKLAIALGKDINGRIVTADLAGMPHVLIAGSTGSGKSVAINAMIMSVLFKSTPEQVRMILVDPKRVELGMYEGIPHLFTPIITEAKLAANALRNAVKEMERRLKLLAANHVRNIDQFNKLFDHGSEYLFEDVNQEPLPYIIIIIDELADLMMLDRSNVEESITRLAQMARAVGIHLILATQRPSVDVITGLIKANVPTRMSFRLATKVDSRTIIDSNGAESLLGRGDMLYLPPGTSRLQRVHAPFVTEKEISAVTEFWRAQGEAEYAQGFLEGPKDEKGDPDEGGEPGSEANDELFDDAVRLVFEFGKASTSLLQRRLRIGYGRAAHLIDMMYNDGLVGPADGSKPRELLKSAEFYKEVDTAMR
jgi:S-DNA-T family DNA segregation ATPase FtsK/SpoIIIE